MDEDNKNTPDMEETDAAEENAPDTKDEKAMPDDSGDGDEKAPAPPKGDSGPKEPWYKNKIIQISIAVSLIFFGSILYVVVDEKDDNLATDTELAATDAAVELAAAVGLVEGSAQMSADSVTWTDLEGGETINTGMYVRTQADGRVVILLDDGSAVRLDNSSQVKLAVSDSTQVDFMLESGQVYSRVVNDGSRIFTIVTANERFEALGTAYKTSTGEKMDEVEVYQSKVKVDSDGTEVDEGNKYDTDSKETTDIDLDELKDDDFIQWNKTQDEEDEDFKDLLGVLDDEKDEEEEDDDDSDDSSSSASITLEGEADDDGIEFGWDLSGVSAPDGFKLVRAKGDTTPTYGEDTSVYIGAGKTSYFLNLTDGKTYYFRICVYKSSNSSCSTYSNAVQVTAPEFDYEDIDEGDVTLSIDGDVISWEAEGTAPHGFKILLSTEMGPTYPANSIKYVGAETDEYELPDKPAGTYYVKVCKYDPDPEATEACVDYSNEVEYVVS